MLKRFRYAAVFVIAVLAIAGLFWGRPVSAAESECVNCHTSAKKLVKITRTLAKEKPAVNKVESKGPGWGGEVEPLAPHERVFVDEDLFDDQNHGDIACQDCHGGNPGYHPDWCAHVR